MATGLLSGVLFCLSQSGGAWGLFGFVALAPLLVYLPYRGALRGAAVGAWAGFVGFGCAGEWGLLFGKHAWLALAAVPSAYLAVFGALAGALLRRRLSAIIWVCPALWILMDWLRVRVPLGGYGLAQIGYSQVDLVWGQLAVWGGTLLVTATVVAVNAAIALLIMRAREGGFPRAPAIAVFSLVSVGTLAAMAVPATGAQGTLRVGVIQIYDENRALTSAEDAENSLLKEFESETILYGRGNDLVIWPEGSLRASVPERDPETIAAVSSAARATGSWILANGQPVNEGGETFVNRNYLFDPAGDLVATSDKERLVPFGEYVPWRGFWRGWVSSIDRVPLDAVPGEYRNLRLPKAGMGALICFESTFSEPARAAVRDGAGFLVVETNNRSFERSTLSRQHLIASRMRAIESGRAVIHAAISGISAYIAPDGTVEAEAGLFERAVMSRDVQVRSGLTPYGHLGDMPVVVMAMFILAVVTMRQWRHRSAVDADSGRDRSESG